MEKFTQAAKDFWNDEEGLTVIEYVIGAAMLVFAVTTVFDELGDDLSGKLEDIVGQIKDKK